MTVEELVGPQDTVLCGPHPLSTSAFSPVLSRQTGPQVWSLSRPSGEVRVPIPSVPRPVSPVRAPDVVFVLLVVRGARMWCLSRRSLSRLSREGPGCGAHPVGPCPVRPERALNVVSVQ